MPNFRLVGPRLVVNINGNDEQKRGAVSRVRPRLASYDDCDW